jgi:hypothetical protein
MLTSPDGIEWKEAGEPPEGDLRGAAWSGRLFAVVGRAAGTEARPLVATSPDGTTWTMREAPDTGPLDCVAWIDNRFVALGRKVLLTSRDGEEWIAGTPASDDDLVAVAGNGSRLVLVGKGAVGDDRAAAGRKSYGPVLLTSRDGSHWTREWFAMDGALAGIAWNGDRFVAVGQSRSDVRPHALIVTEPAPPTSSKAPQAPSPVPPGPASGPAPTPVPGPLPATGPTPALRHAPQPAPHIPKSAPAPPPVAPEECGTSYQWHEGRCFVLDRVEGLKTAYGPEADVVLKVFGRAVNSDVDVSRENGFGVQAVIYRADGAPAWVSANGVWDDEVHGWLLSMTLPKKRRPGYVIQIGLGCANDDAICASAYGRAAGVTRQFTFDIP